MWSSSGRKEKRREKNAKRMKKLLADADVQQRGGPARKLQDGRITLEQFEWLRAELLSDVAAAAAAGRDLVRAVMMITATICPAAAMVEVSTRRPLQPHCRLRSACKEHDHHSGSSSNSNTRTERRQLNTCRRSDNRKQQLPQRK